MDSEKIFCLRSIEERDEQQGTRAPQCVRGVDEAPEAWRWFRFCRWSTHQSVCSVWVRDENSSKHTKFAHSRHYVDNNSTPTIASNLLQENTFLSLLSLLSGRQALRASVRCDNRPYLLLLCATIPVIGDNPTPYPSLAVASVEACDAKKSSKARRAIMPRLALRPVWLSSRSR